MPAELLPYVAGGLGYELNVSLQRHGTNPAQLPLIGKILTIVEGTGAGQQAVIVDYEAETSQYTLSSTGFGVWTATPDDTSRYEIAQLMSVDFPSYRPITDYYEVVLTAAPTANVTVTVEAAPTRTLNADLVFDPDANFGANEEIQVMPSWKSRCRRERGWPCPFRAGRRNEQ